MVCSGFDERELSPVFEDPLPIIRKIVGGEPEIGLLERLDARKGRRSTSEQPSEEQRAEFSKRAVFDEWAVKSIADSPGIP